MKSLSLVQQRPGRRELLRGAAEVYCGIARFLDEQMRFHEIPRLRV